MKIFKLILIVWLILPSTSQAQIYVDLSATGNNDGSSWEDAFTDIQSAVNAAMDNEEIQIAEGFYQQGAEILITKALVIKGGYPTGGGVQDITNHPTILDGENSYRVLKYDVDANQSLEGLTIQNGRITDSTGGAGILSINNSDDKVFNLTQVKLSSNEIDTPTINKGGAIYTFLQSIVFNNCEVSNNTSNSRSGGAESLLNITAYDTKFINNTGQYGGAIFANTNLSLTDVLVANNSADSVGGVYVGNGDLTLINASIVKNHSSNSTPGGVQQASTSAATNTIRNTIIALNTAVNTSQPQETLSPLAIQDLTYSFIQGANYSGTGNFDDSSLNLDPLFVDEANNDFNLQNNSPLVNRGDPSENRPLTDVDANGDPRETSCFIDLGAMEVQNNINYINNVIYVDTAATGENDGSTWQDAFTSVQRSITQAKYAICNATEKTIQIAQGTYMEGGELVVDEPLFIKGSYPTGGGTQDFENNPTIIDGNNSHRVLRTTHANVETLFLDHLVLQNGNQLLGGGINSTGNLDLNFVTILSNDSNTGAGIYVLDANIELSNSQVLNNSASNVGAGIYNFTGNITLSNSQVLNNDAFINGAGIYVNEGNVHIINSQINNNSLQSSSSVLVSAGGGIYLLLGNVTVINSEINNNSIDAQSVVGGGIYSGIGDITLINSRVNNNAIISAPPVSVDTFSYGGGIATFSGAVTLTSSLVSNNKASSSSNNSGFASESFGGGIYREVNSQGVKLINSLVINNQAITDSASSASSSGGGIYGGVELDNSILWGNTISENEGSSFTPSEHEFGTLIANYSLIKNQNPTGTANIDATTIGFDPLFADEMNGDFSLLLGSPLIDAGDFSLLPSDDFDVDGDGDVLESIPLDLGGYARDVGFNVDIGPYEYGDLIYRNGFE